MCCEQSSYKLYLNKEVYYQVINCGMSYWDGGNMNLVTLPLSPPTLTQHTHTPLTNYACTHNTLTHTPLTQR